MIQQFKRAARQGPLRPFYIWFAERYRQWRRLFLYPDTARVGHTDYNAYWDEKFQQTAGTLSSWRERRAAVFTDIVSAGDRVLDIGVGDGALLAYMLARKDISVYGLDVSPKAVAFCESQGIPAALADANQPITTYINAPFDYAIMSEIIEHMPEPETLLNDLRPHIRKALIVSVPNTGFYQHRLRLLFGRFPLQWVVTPGEHLRFWTYRDFRWWAGELGFSVRAIPYEGTPLLRDWWPALFASAFVYVLTDTREE